MSSWKKGKVQKVHRERPQPEERAHLGMLERKKDYQWRAKQFHKKDEAIKKLKRKADDRNPDEFYFNMTKTKRWKGEHVRRNDAEPVTTEEQHKLMSTQDKKYVMYRLSKELKKIERLRKSLHLIDSSEKKNSHTIFVDDEDEVESFDVAKFFDTHPAFLDRTFNRPKLEMLKNGKFSVDPEELKAVMESKNSAYNELSKRMDRARELKVILEKLDAKLFSLDKTSKKKCVADETKETAAQYKFKFQRKK